MISYFLLNNIFSEEPYQIFLYNSLGWRFLSGIIFYFFIASLYYVIVYYSEIQERIKKESELKSLVSLAELRTLKFQLNPHFLFNALNSLSALTTEDPVRAGNMTIKISDFLRYSLSNSEKQKNKLAEEINILKLYMDIEKIRFGDKVEFSEELDDKCLDIEVPNMILHPLIENAFKHGVYEAMGVININLTASIKDETLCIILSNNYEGHSKHKKGEGVGLKNTSSRLDLLYNGRARLDIKDEQGIFSVKLVIPLG
jgi:LytS/YehU family sensor histidine kinase